MGDSASSIDLNALPPNKTGGPKGPASIKLSSLLGPGPSERGPSTTEAPAALSTAGGPVKPVEALRRQEPAGTPVQGTPMEELKRAAGGDVVVFKVDPARRKDFTSAMYSEIRGRYADDADVNMERVMLWYYGELEDGGQIWVLRPVFKPTLLGLMKTMNLAGITVLEQVPEGVRWLQGPRGKPLRPIDNELILDVLEWFEALPKLPEPVAKLKAELEQAVQAPRVNVALVAARMAEYLREKHKVRVPVVRDAVLGVYCYEGGRYVECSRRLGNEVQSMYKELKMEEKGVKYRGLKAEVMAQLEDSSIVEHGFNHHMLLFKNKVVNWKALVYEDRLEVLDPSPDLMVYHKIPWELDFDTLQKYAGASREELRKITEVELGELVEIFKQWVGEKWPLLVEIIGYTLLAGEYPLNKAIMLVGEGRNGKSTFLRVIDVLLGPGNITHVKLQDLTGDRVRFMAAQLYGKMANVYADIPDTALEYTGDFKVLTGEDPVTVDRKFRDPITFTNYAKLLFSANRLPEVHDMTLAFWRRWIVLEFPNQFPPNEAFQYRLYTELLPKYAPKLLALALLMVRHVVKDGKFSFEETEADYKEKWLRETNSVYAFVQDMLKGGYLVRDPAGRVEAGELYNMYTEYCKAEERETVSKKKFSEEMERLGFKRTKSGGTRYYAGLRLVKKYPEPGGEEAAGGLYDYTVTRYEV